jgi:hypothetical protein
MSRPRQRAVKDFCNKRKDLIGIQDLIKIASKRRLRILRHADLILNEGLTSRVIIF